MSGEREREERDRFPTGTRQDGFESRKASATGTASEEVDESDAEAANAAAEEILTDEVDEEGDSSQPSALERLGPLHEPCVRTMASVETSRQKLSIVPANAVSLTGATNGFWRQLCPVAVVNQESVSVEESLVPKQNATERVTQVVQPTYSIASARETVAVGCEPSAARESVMTVERPQAVSTNQEFEFIMPQEKIESDQNKSHSTLLAELFEFEPMSGSEGESLPIGRRRPQVIIHEQPSDDTQSFEFLCRFLRDYYSTIEGGEPSVEPVEFVTNSPRVPSLSNRIFRLDMTGDEWEISVESDALRARRNNTDVLPKLAEVVRTQFSGKLGFLVINVPANAGTSLFRESEIGAEVYQFFIDELQCDGESPRTVISAAPHDTGNTDWAAKFAEYLRFECTGQKSSVAAVEDAYWNTIEQLDWRAIALTERQNTGEEGGESDQHYLHKAAIARAIGIEAFESESASKTDEGEFFDAQTMESISTEAKTDSAVPDIMVDLTKHESFVQGLDNLVREEIPWTEFSKAAFEVETGKQEGAFKFRKVQETLDKIESEEIDFIGIVVPPWVIEIDRNGEDIIENLVSHWNKTSEDKTAKLLTPQFNSERCTGLLSGDE